MTSKSVLRRKTQASERERGRRSTPPSLAESRTRWTRRADWWADTGWRERPALGFLVKANNIWDRTPRFAMPHTEMTAPKKMGFFEEIHFMWVHSRPHTKRGRSRLALGFIGFCAAAVIANQLHLPNWLGMALSVIPWIYMVRAGLIVLIGEAKWDMEEKNKKLDKLLTSPDLNQRFTALGHRLRGSDVEELSQLQDAMEFGAREAQRLAEEMTKYEDITIALRERQDEDRRSAESIAELLDCQVDRVAGMIERKGRPNQWFFLIVGAILGAILAVAFQALIQWIF
jgi:hypothetical protein